MVLSASLANLLNPKLTIFFFAFLPQFVPGHSRHQLTTMLTLSAAFMVMSFVVFALYGVLAAAVRQAILDHPRIIQMIRRTFAVVFLGFGAKLATTAR